RNAWHKIWVKAPGTLYALLQESFALRSTSKFEEAREIIELALRRASPTDRTLLLIELGVIHHNQGRYEEAVRAYDAALAIEPDSGTAYLWKVRSLCSSNRRKDAEKVIRQALDRVALNDAWRAQIICEMGRMHEAREGWEAALNSYNEALGLASYIADIHF